MKLLWALLVLITVSGIAQATYINDQAFGLGNGAYITVNTTTIDDVNQLACCDNNELMMRINGSMTNYTAGANKTITSVTLNNVTDIFTLPVTGDAGYINFSVIMQNASNSYNLTADAIFIESRNTTTDGKVWFNYTGDATLSVSWNNSIAGTATNGTPNITAYYNTINGWNQTAMSVNAGNSVTFNVTVNQTVNNVSWKVEGAEEQNTSSLQFTRVFNTLGTFNVTAQAFNSNCSSNIIYTVVTVSATGGGGTIHRSLTGAITPTGSTIVTTVASGHSACSETGGSYSCQYKYHDGNSYWINVSKAGYQSNNSYVLFDDDIVWNVTLAAITAPTITSLNNSKTNTATTTLSVTVGDTVIFSSGANQIVTTWTWGGATKLGGDGTTNSTASKTFSSVGSISVTVYGTNSNGTSATSTWTVNVVAAPANPYNYTVAYSYNCNQARGGGVSFEFMKSFNAITLFIIVILLIFIIKMIQENLIVGILSTVIIVIFIGTLLPSIAGWSTEVACVDWSESHNISGMADSWIVLPNDNILADSETISNSSYIGIKGTDYNMDYNGGRFYPLSTGNFNFGS